MKPKKPHNLNVMDTGRVDEDLSHSKHCRVNGTSVSSEWSSCSDSADSDIEDSNQKSFPIKARKKAFCFYDDSTNSSSDVPLSKLILFPVVKKPDSNIESNFNPTTNASSRFASESIVSDCESGGVMSLSNPLVNGDSNSSDAPLIHFKGKKIPSIGDESSVEVTPSKIKTKNLIFSEDSSSADVSDRAGQTSNSSDDVPIRKISPVTQSRERGTNKINKRKRAIGSDDDEEAPQPKVKKNKKNVEGATNPKIKKNQIKKRDNSLASSIDVEIFSKTATNEKSEKERRNESHRSEDDCEKTIVYSNEVTAGSDSISNLQARSSEEESDSSIEVKLKTPRKSSQLKNKSVSSPNPSVEKANATDNKTKIQLESSTFLKGQNSPSPHKSVKSNVKQTAFKTKKQLDSSSRSTSESECENEKHDSTDSEVMKIKKPTNRMKKERHKKVQKKKILEGSLIVDKGDTKIDENSRLEKELMKKAQSNTSSANSESSTDSEDEDKENVAGKKEVAAHEPCSSKTSEIKNKTNTSSSSSSKDSSDSEKEEKVTKKSKVGKSGASKQSPDSKAKKDNPRIVRLQRYLKVAGIRVPNYKVLWEGCKSDKAKAEKLLELMEDHGLKGKPTLSECKKLRKKIETEKEIAELNPANIIQIAGRPRRNTQSLYATTPFKDEENSSVIPYKSPEFKKAFSRLKTIVDSEDSD